MPGIHTHAVLTITLAEVIHLIELNEIGFIQFVALTQKTEYFLFLRIKLKFSDLIEINSNSEYRFFSPFWF